MLKYKKTSNFFAETICGGSSHAKNMKDVFMHCSNNCKTQQRKKILEIHVGLTRQDVLNKHWRKLCMCYQLWWIVNA